MRSNPSRPLVDGMRSPAAITLVACAILVVACAIHYAQAFHWNVIDDAAISFQYAKNWSLGRGVVFNPGERVEGYTNFLWIALLTPVHAVTARLGLDFTRAAIWLSIAFAVLNLGLVYVVGRRLFDRDWVAVSVTLLLCAFDSSFQGYAMSGMENHLVMTLALGAVWVWAARPRRMWLWLGVLTALGTMARPDAGLFLAALVFAVAAGFALPAWGRDGLSRRSLVVGLLGLSVAWLAVYGAYFLWRFTYYGELLPNTFYLKAGGHLDAVDRGLEYTWGFFAYRYYLPVAALLSLPWLHRTAVRWMLAFLAMHLAYVTYVGGDFYGGHRFYVSLLPFFYLLIGVVFHGTRRWIGSSRPWLWVRRTPAMAAACVAVSTGALAWLGFMSWERGFDQGFYNLEVVPWHHVVDRHVQHMKWLRTVAPPNASVLLGNIGAAGFYADVAVVDVLGVVDPAIAHMEVPSFGKGKAGHEKRGNRPYLLSKQPTYILAGWVGGDLRQQGYYVFTDFPPHVDIESMWARDDLEDGRRLSNTATHFAPSELQGWLAEGTAFQAVPTTKALFHQSRVLYHDGPYINTYGIDGLGDRATGRLLSPEFELEGDKMSFNIGGGRDPERLRVSLLIDGRRVFDATGHDFETLGRRVWNIEPFKGSRARLEIVDDKVDGWGHILVDEVVQWSRDARSATRK